jgi:hypothetical protein
LETLERGEERGFVKNCPTIFTIEQGGKHEIVLSPTTIVVNRW